LGGFSARLTRAQLGALGRNPAVATILPDEQVDLGDVMSDMEAGGVRTTGNPGLRVPAGVRRVGARNAAVMGVRGGGRVNADVAILDTGIQRDHPDLNVVGGFNCTSRNRTKWDDNNGHGTHVAGIVGALDNNIGVVGVAAGARLWSVKVLDRSGHGSVSSIVCGIDWVTGQRQRGAPSRPLFEVANMSISFTLPGSNDRDCGRQRHDGVHMAICRSVKRGTTYAVAAGNESRNARRNRPAAYDEVITVSAMADYDGRPGGRGKASDSCPYWSAEPDDAFARFSNYGADVDLIAPGKCVLSTYIRGRYAWMSGTSMASPHVAGAAAIYRSMYPRATPHQTRLALQAVGTLDWRTSSDPDRGAHERAVWVGNFRAMPDFGMSARKHDGSAGAGQRFAIDVTLSRVGGFADPVAVSLVEPPTGFSSGQAVIGGSTGALEVRLGDDVDPGQHTLTVKAIAADVERNVTLQVTVAGDPPSASFVSPAAGVTSQSAATTRVGWVETPGDAPIATRQVERQSAPITETSTCDESGFVTDYSYGQIEAPTEQLRRGFCYRWLLTLTDTTGAEVTVSSGTVLVD
ncbi:MAG TPA: S8 family serine peptidase, partial [Candidatus Limnocylindrales bacterium]|nr:S8 family serine peptidase [Candidatus Limnocylindrales bacterium]